MSTWSDNPDLIASTGGSGRIAVGGGSRSSDDTDSGTGTASSLQSLQSGSTFDPSSIPDAPDAPDISELTGLFDRVPNLFNPRKIGRAFNDTINTTRSQGFQAASNASKSYAAREMQMGINPVSAGVVEAQARAPVYGAVNDLTRDKEAAKQKVRSEGASLSAQIASAIGGIRENYVKTLADYNLGAAGLAERSSEFTTATGESREQIDYARSKADEKEAEAKNARVGYIPDQGPIDPSTGFPWSNSNSVHQGSGIPQNPIGLRVA